MKITKKICEAVKIYNNYDYAGNQPYLYYSGADHGRWYRPAHWAIAQRNRSFSENWQDYNAKVFNVYYHEDKGNIFEQAKAWMLKVLHVGDIVKTPFGSWMDADYVKSRNAQIEQMYKELLEKEKNSG